MHGLRLIIIGIIISALLFTLVGFRQVRVLMFVPGPAIVNMPFGDSADAVGRAVGIDGRLYGPLTFGTNGSKVVVADTYRERLIIVGKDHFLTMPLTGKMVENVLITPSGSVIMADNRSMALWKLENAQVSKLVQLPRTRGYSEAIWKIAVGPHGSLYVEQVKLGKGTFASWIDEYTPSGILVRRLAATEGARTPDLAPLTMPMITEPIRNFTVGFNRDLYIESYSTNARERIIHIYRKNGTYVGKVGVHTDYPIYDSALLGVNQEGWVYLGVNMNTPHEAHIIVENPSGHTMASIAVPAVPMYATTYGAVMSSGTLYWDASSVTHYRILPYRLEVHRVWTWFGH